MATEAASFAIEAELNGDGVLDKATLITNGLDTKLVATVSDGQATQTIEVLATHHPAAECAIRLIGPGSYRTACGKGYFDCGPDPEVLVLDRPALSFSDENVEIVLLFEGVQVRKVWLSD